MIEDDLLQRILKLTNDLNVQQQANQDIASGIKSQINEFKHRSTVNIDTEDLEVDNDFLPELLPANAININDTNDALAGIATKHSKLLQEHTYFKSRNRELEQECTELQALILQYESSLDLIAGKLRTCAAATSEGKTQLRREYEALLDAEKETTVALFMENVFLQSRLKKLSGILRNSYEENTSMTSYDTQIQQLTIENEGLRTMLAISDQQSSSPPVLNSAHTCYRTTTTPILQTAKASSGVIQEFFEGDSNNSNGDSGGSSNSSSSNGN